MHQAWFDHHILVVNVIPKLVPLGDEEMLGTVGDLMTHCKQLLGGIVVLLEGMIVDGCKERLFKSDCFSDFNQQSTDG
jgi:hypothetical protein